ncbi:MAG: hypothetical protein ACE5JR_05695 [Gemmatimonadota bacterium]
MLSTAALVAAGIVGANLAIVAVFWAVSARGVYRRHGSGPDSAAPREESALEHPEPSVAVARVNIGAGSGGEFTEALETVGEHA